MKCAFISGDRLDLIFHKALRWMRRNQSNEVGGIYLRSAWLPTWKSVAYLQPLHPHLPQADWLSAPLYQSSSSIVSAAEIQRRAGLSPLVILLISFLRLLLSLHFPADLLIWSHKDFLPPACFPMHFPSFLWCSRCKFPAGKSERSTFPLHFFIPSPFPLAWVHGHFGIWCLFGSWNMS